jgi:Tol biopolymer transport system component
MKSIFLRAIFELLLICSFVFGLILPGRVQAQSFATVRVSVASDGTQADEVSYSPSLSGDGRFVAYTSLATNLIMGDTNGMSDVFVFDRQLGTTVLVSVTNAGTYGNGHSHYPSISFDGQHVAFVSTAHLDINHPDQSGFFVRDLNSGITEWIAWLGEDCCFTPSLSSDGRYVAFNTDAADLVAGDTNQVMDVFIRDRQNNLTELVSISNSGGYGNDYSVHPSISPDGRYIAFSSLATNLVDTPTLGIAEAYVRDRETGTTQLVSVAGDGTPGNDGLLSPPAISEDGRYVAFLSPATNLVNGDTNEATDIFVFDRQTSTTRRVSVASDGSQGNGVSDMFAMTPDGRFIAFRSTSSNLVSGDTNNSRDIFVHDLLTGMTERVSIANDGGQANAASYDLSISADGSVVSFGSNATNLVADDTNGVGDIFVRARAVNDPKFRVLLPYLQVPLAPVIQ